MLAALKPPLPSSAGSPAYRPALPAVPGALPELTPANTEFVLVSFEGPDAYSNAGGLGVRVTELSRALAERGFETHLYFIGDPEGDPEEKVAGLPLRYHRWGQWLSRHHPRGVYDGEEAKRRELRHSLPPRLVSRHAGPAAERGKRLVVLSEEWHTADTACDLSDALHHAGLRRDAVLMWNANNTLGFENVDFGRLAFTQTVSTVSRWMKHEMWKWGCDPVVVPNGIPAGWLEPSRRVEQLAEMAQRRLRDRLCLVKVARFDPDKRWLMAVEAAASLKRKGLPVLFLARGGVEAHGGEVLARARELGLRVRDAACESPDSRLRMQALLDACEGADLVNLRFHLDEPMKRALFRVADAVVQNSGREPFGLVGLEVMAAGGVAVTGATGEEYARPWENAVVLDTADPAELEAGVLALLAEPAAGARIRREGPETAARYTWTSACDLLLRRLRYLAGKS